MAKKRPSRKTSKSTSRTRVARATAAAGNGLKTYTIHSADEASGPMLAKLRDERPHTMAFSESAAPLPQLDPETAATRYLQQALKSPAVPSLAARPAGGNTSEFKSLGTVTVPLTGTKVVKYRQTYAGIPVYGSLVTVEVDEKNELVSLNSSLGQPDGVSAVAKISPDDALKTIAKAPRYSKDLKGIVPHLNFYFDNAKSKWRLVFIAQDVPVKRTGAKPAAKTKDAALSPLYMDYVVDAHTGVLVAQLPRTPSMAAVSETGIDGKGVMRSFQVENSGTQKTLTDSQAHIQTFDFGFDDPQAHESALP